MDGVVRLLRNEGPWSLMQVVATSCVDGLYYLSKTRQRLCSMVCVLWVGCSLLTIRAANCSVHAHNRTIAVVDVS